MTLVVLFSALTVSLAGTAEAATSAPLERVRASYAAPAPNDRGAPTPDLCQNKLIYVENPVFVGARP